MNTRYSKIAAIAVLLPALLCASAADEMSDLRARFQSRDAKLTELKKSGTLGETYLGYIDAPSSPPAAAKSLMDEENTDRKRLYALIAQKEGVTPDLVATRAANRNFARASAGEMLKYSDGQWKKK